MSAVGSRLVKWYAAHKRDLPWRATRDPYKIWLSEIILQQTRVQQGLSYYLRFVKRYPTLADLATSSEKDILLLWQGLGYYARARNLRACAQKIIVDFGGQFPTDYKTLLGLPGIGSYTAAAIASFAAKECLPALDGNAFRVIARYYACELNIAETKNRAWFFDKAAAMMDKKHPDEFNQGMMELGALICKPQKPACDNCPLQVSCRAYAQGSQTLFPVKEKKKSLKHRYLHYYVIEKQGRVLLRRRDAQDIWKGLFEYALIETKSTAPPVAEPMLEGLEPVLAKQQQQALTHQKLHLFFYYARAPKAWRAPNGYQWHTPQEARRLPMPISLEKHRTENC